MSEYTPTTDEVRDGFSNAYLGDGSYTAVEKVIERQESEFDRWLAAHDADVRKPLEYRIAEDEKRALRTLELDREFLQQVADSYGIRTDEVTTAFLARQPKERADVRKAAMLEAAQIARGIADALAYNGDTQRSDGAYAAVAAIRAAALGDAPTGGE